VLAQIKRLHTNEEAFGGAATPRYRHAYGLLQEALYNQAVRAGDPWQFRELKPWLSEEILAAAYSADLQKMFVLKSQSSTTIDDVRRICPEIEAIGERDQCNRRGLNMSAELDLKRYQTGDWRDWRVLQDHMSDFKNTDSEDPSIYLLQRKLEAAAVPGVKIPMEELAQVCHLIASKGVASACAQRVMSESLDQADHEWTQSWYKWENIQQVKNICEQDRDCLARIERLEWKVATRIVVDGLSDQERGAGRLLFAKQDWLQILFRLDKDAQSKFGGTGDSFLSLAPELRKRLSDGYSRAQSRSEELANRAGWAWSSLQSEIEQGLRAGNWQANKRNWVDKMDVIAENEADALRLDQDERSPLGVRKAIKEMKWRLDQPAPASEQTKEMAAGVDPDVVGKVALGVTASGLGHLLGEMLDWILAVIF
jgi:hypothetical protein